jgi:hypothetical protein
VSSCGENCGYCGRCDGDARPDALCQDCNAEFWTRPNDDTPLCTDCCNKRDAWADAFDARLAAERQMMKADLTIVPKKDVA